MVAAEKPLSKFLKFVFWFVVVNSVLGAFALILFPTRTETFFFWKITPPINSMLVGSLYLVAGLAVAYAALRGTWETARVMIVMSFALSVVLVIVTLMHVDRFVPGAKLAYWLFVYIAFPVAVLILYRRYEKDGANWQVTNQAIQAMTRSAALVVGFGLLLAAIAGFFAPGLFIGLNLWQTSDLMVRFYVAWFTSLSVSNLWFWVEKEWTRVQLVAYMLIIMPIVMAAIILVNRSALTGSPSGLFGFFAALILLGGGGLFMLWQQRRRYARVD